MRVAEPVPAEPVGAEDVRRRCRRGELVGPTAGLAPGFEQANLVVLPSALADAFARFCELNPRPCPLLDRTAPGDPVPRRAAPGADLRTDLPRYRVFRHGEPVDEPTSIEDVWRGDLVAFLLGCSFSFENALLAAGLPVRHVEEGKNVPMFRTRRACVSAPPFEAPLVVSMRPMTPGQERRAAEITARFPRAHGAPVALGEELVSSGSTICPVPTSATRSPCGRVRSRSSGLAESPPNWPSRRLARSSPSPMRRDRC